MVSNILVDIDQTPVLTSYRQWYHAAQQVRVLREAETGDPAVDDDSDDDRTPGAPLEDVPEEGDEVPATEPQISEIQVTPQQQSALKELYVHEVLALISCFVLPLVSAYLLHAIRSQLSRPSEGLVSNYNLTIFLLVAELRAMSHMIKLVQARTLHLQKVVHSNPYGGPSTATLQLDDVLARIELLESRAIIHGNPSDPSGSQHSELTPEAMIVKDVRQAIQPDLDALNRAVRRYEKKATTLQYNTESRLAVVDARLDDAIALAAVAAKNSNANQSLFTRLFDSLVAAVLFPFNAILQILTLPLRPILALSQRKQKKRDQAPVKTTRASRTAKLPGQPRFSGERAPGRLSKR